MHRPVLWDANYRLRDAKAPTPGPREFTTERESDRITHRYIYDSRRGLAQRETCRDGRSMLAVTRFVTTFQGGPTLFADSDGTVDVSMTDPFGRPWYMYRSREGSKPWYDQTPDANGRGTGILSTPPLPGSLFPGYAPWHLRTAEPDYLMGRRGVLGYDGSDRDLGLLLDAPQDRTEANLSWFMKAGLLLDPVVNAWHGIGNWWNSQDTWDKKLRAGVGIGFAVLGAAVAITALPITGPMFFIGMALAGAAGYVGINLAIHAADSNYGAQSIARDMLIGGLAGLASAAAMLWAAGGAAGLAAACEGGGITMAGIEAAGGMAFGTTSSLLEGRSMQESLANGLAAATMAVVLTVAAMGLARGVGVSTGARSVSIRAGVHAQHSAWAHDINAVTETMYNLGLRSLRLSRGDGYRAEKIFEQYVRRVGNRLERMNSRFGVEWQPAALADGTRVPGFISYRSAETPRPYAFPSSRRLDAGIVDLGRVTTSDYGAFNRLVRGFDITIDASKPDIVRYYQEYFGNIPIYDIRLP